MSETLLEALQSILRYRHRAIATGFGVFWGVFIVTVLQAGGTGLHNGLAAMYKDSARSLVWVWSDRTSLAHHGLAAGRSVPLRMAEFEILARHVPELENLSPRYSAPITTHVLHGLRESNPQVIGVYPDYRVSEQIVMTRGRWLNTLDVRAGRRVAVVGVATLSVLFGPDDPIGAELRIAGAPFEVVGVFDDPGGGMESQRVYVPYSVVPALFGTNDRVQVIVGTLRDDADIPTTRHKVRAVLSRSLGMSPEDPRGVGAWFAAEQYRRLQVLMRGIAIAILLVGLGTLLSGMVGVCNILYVTVRERAHEFGVRRALGGTASSIVRLVLTEACMLSLLAGGAGLGLSAGCVHLARRAGIETEYFSDPSIDFRDAAVTFVALFLSALVAGWFPAREASRMHPVEALTRT